MDPISAHREGVTEGCLDVRAVEHVGAGAIGARTWGPGRHRARPDQSTSNTNSVTGTAASIPAPGRPTVIRRCSKVKSGRGPDRATISPSRIRQDPNARTPSALAARRALRRALRARVAARL
jgi:hypothetical protein